MTRGRKPGYYEKKDEFVTDAGQTLSRVHKRGECRNADGHCTIHNPSEKAKRIGYTYWRDDRGIMERICPGCGCGHPDPDSPWPAESAEWIHGCCGRCFSECSYLVRLKLERESDG